MLVPPDFRRRFKGRVSVHDAEAGDLVDLGRSGNVDLRVNPALVETDLVVTVTAAETVLHGGPAALLAASGRESLRAAGALSLLETSSSQGWKLAVEIERRLSERVPVTGVSLALNAPRLGGPFAGYPHDQEAIDRVIGSRVRRVFQFAPGRVRQRVLERLPREQTAAAVYAGTPSVAHTEALLRATVLKGVSLGGAAGRARDRDPADDALAPRERPNPITAAYLGLGLALRLWRNAPPIAAGGTVILIHPLPRRFERPTQTPYRALFYEPRTARDVDAMREAELAAVLDEHGARRLPLRTRLPSAAAVRRVERLRRSVTPPRCGPDRRLQGRVRRPAARLRSRPRPRGRARDGARPRRPSHRLPADAAVLPPRRRGPDAWPSSETRSLGRMDTVIETRGLTKRFGDRTAVDAVDLTVPAGVAFGFLGPNGAGKTTLIRTLVGLTQPTSGTVALLGLSQPAKRAEALARVGAIVEEPRFHPHLTGRENLQVIAAARDRAAEARIPESLDRVGLAQRADDRVKTYSLGMRQRLGIARCLIADPALLILDEPMNGLDPAGILEMRHLIRAFVTEGRTVFLSSHLLDEVEKTCDQIAIVDQGRIVVQGGVQEIAASGDPTLLIEVDDEAAARRVLDGSSIEAEGHALRVKLQPGRNPAEINRALVEAGVAVSRLEPARASLEEKFLEITSRLESNE